MNRKPIPMREGDLLRLKKKHPCGGTEFRVLRTGSDIRVICVNCGRDITLPRLKLEPNIKEVIRSDETTDLNEHDT